MEILTALIAAEQQGVFKRNAVIPYFLKKAAWNSDRPYENTDWGTPPRVKVQSQGNALNYRELQKKASAMGIGKRCLHMKGPALEAEIRKAEYERRQSQIAAPGLSGHEGISSEDGSVGESAPGSTIERVGEVSPEDER